MAEKNTEEQNVKLETYDRTRKTPFNGWNKINRVKQTFSNGGTIRRNGKEINLQEFINANNEDCTIYQVFEKYCGNKKLTAEKLNVLTHEVSQDLSEINGLADALEVMKKAEASWKKLPLEIRNEFGNSVANFQKNGLSWANKKIAEAEEAKKAILQKQAETTQQAKINFNQKIEQEAK